MHAVHFSPLCQELLGKPWLYFSWELSMFLARVILSTTTRPNSVVARRFFCQVSCQATTLFTRICKYDKSCTTTSIRNNASQGTVANAEHLEWCSSQKGQKKEAGLHIKAQDLYAPNHSKDRYFLLPLSSWAFSLSGIHLTNRIGSQYSKIVIDRPLTCATQSLDQC